MPDDRAVFARCLVRAFFDCPLIKHILPSGRRSLRDRVRYFEMMFASVDTIGGRHMISDGRSGAIWRLPNRTKEAAAPKVILEEAKRLRILFGLHLTSVQKKFDALEAHHPTFAHIYISAIGTDPSFQRHGLASELLATCIAQADHDYLPIYLEVAKPESQQFFERRGFQPIHSFSMPENGPKVTGMLRPVNTPDHAEEKQSG